MLCLACTYLSCQSNLTPYWSHDLQFYELSGKMYHPDNCSKFTKFSPSHSPNDFVSKCNSYKYS